MGETEAAVLRLVYFRGLTPVQAAGVLGVSSATVRGYVARGVRELADRLMQAC